MVVLLQEVMVMCGIISQSLMHAVFRVQNIFLTNI